MSRLSEIAPEVRPPPRPAKGQNSGLFVGLALVQGLYYLATGVWPLIDIGSFQAVTGPKTDLWLVHTVGVLVTVIGLVLLAAGWRRQATPEVLLLAIGSIVALTGIDLVYTSRGVIAPVYLVDALGEVIILLGWLVVIVQIMRAERTESPAAS
jgi:hypothetical protein